MIPASQTVELINTAITELTDITDRLREIECRFQTERSARLAAEDKIAELEMMASPEHDGLPYSETRGKQDAA